MADFTRSDTVITALVDGEIARLIVKLVGLRNATVSLDTMMDGCATVRLLCAVQYWRCPSSRRAPVYCLR